MGANHSRSVSSTNIATIEHALGLSYLLPVKCLTKLLHVNKNQVDPPSQMESLTQNDEEMKQQFEKMIKTYERNRHLCEKKIDKLKSVHKAELSRVNAECQKQMSILAGIVQKLRTKVDVQSRQIISQSRDMERLAQELSLERSKNIALEAQVSSACQIGIQCASEFEDLSVRMKSLIQELSGTDTGGQLDMEEDTL